MTPPAPGTVEFRELAAGHLELARIWPVAVTGNRALTCNDWWAILGLNQ